VAGDEDRAFLTRLLEACNRSVARVEDTPDPDLRFLDELRKFCAEVERKLAAATRDV
jgi:hypothetical protein